MDWTQVSSSGIMVVVLRAETMFKKEQCQKQN